ncbi:MAG: HAD family hydrolase [Thermoprotei archaeon]
MSEFRNLSAVVFDYDGTLVDYGEARKAALVTAARLLASELSMDERRVLLELEALQRSMEIYQTLDRDIWWLQAARELGASLENNVAAQVTAAYWREWQKIARPFPVANKVLRALKEKGYRLALVANTDGKPGMKFARMSSSGIDMNVFDLILVAGDDVPDTKPSPQPFITALGFLGLQGHEAIYVGDDPRVDVPGAKEAGMYVIIVSSSACAQEVPPDIILGDLTQLSLALRSQRFRGLQLLTVWTRTRR